MFNYEIALNTLIISLFLSLGFAIYHKMWKYCLAGFMFLILVGFILTLHLLNLINYQIWVVAQFYLISLGCLSTVVLTIIHKYKSYKKRCNNELHH